MASKAVQPQAPETFDLLSKLPHLLRRAHFEAEARFSSIFGDELTSRQLALLMVISQSPGLSQSAAADQIGLDANTCSNLVTRLVSKKLLRRTRSKADGRIYLLSLTPPGLTLVGSVAIRTDAYVDAVAARLSPDETGLLVTLLRKMLVM